MISKLRHFNSSGSNSSEKIAISTVRNHLRNFFADDSLNIEPLDDPAGTLGELFTLETNKKSRVVKTHKQTEENKFNLENEYSFLQLLYRNQLAPEKVTIDDNGEERVYLLTNKIPTNDQQVSVKDILEAIRNYTNRLSQLSQEELPSARYHFNDLLDYSENALENLSRNKLLSDNTCRSIDSHRNTVISNLSNLAPCLCHGDLGPHNILIHDNSPVVIDWEDALWAFEGYDFLYWLTFMSNRKHYKPGIFNSIDLEPALSLAITSLIVLLKSALSVQTGTHVSNQITFDDRLNELRTLL